LVLVVPNLLRVALLEIVALTQCLAQSHLPVVEKVAED
jgi:hypothetical protein